MTDGGTLVTEAKSIYRRKYTHKLGSEEYDSYTVEYKIVCRGSYKHSRVVWIETIGIYGRKSGSSQEEVEYDTDRKELYIDGEITILPKIHYSDSVRLKMTPHAFGAIMGEIPQFYDELLKIMYDDARSFHSLLKVARMQI